MRKLLVILSLLFLSLCLSSHKKHEVEEKEEVKKTPRAVTGVVEWFDTFTARKFKDCDLMVYSRDDKLFSAFLVEDNFYSMTLNALVDSIYSVEVTEHSLDFGKTYYDVTIRYGTYKATSEVILSDQYISIAKDLYVLDRISSENFKRELNRAYLTMFKETCFSELSEPVNEITFTVSSEVFMGELYVFGVGNCIDALLESTNILENLEVFERDAKRYMNSLVEFNDI